MGLRVYAQQVMRLTLVIHRGPYAPGTFLLTFHDTSSAVTEHGAHVPTTYLDKPALITWADHKRRIVRDVSPIWGETDYWHSRLGDFLTHPEDVILRSRVIKHER